MLMQSPSPSCSPFEQALRKYPSEVSQRLQNDLRSSGDKEFKYAKSFSIPSLYRNVKDSSRLICTPVVYMKAPPLEYSGMGEDSVVEVRRARLRKVIKERYKGVQANMVRDTGVNAGELSGLLKTRFFGEKKARTLECHLGLPNMWFDGLDAKQEDAATEAFRWILRHGAENEKSILLATVDAIMAAHKQDAKTQEPSSDIDRRKGIDNAYVVNMQKETMCHDLPSPYEAELLAVFRRLPEASQAIIINVMWSQYVSVCLEPITPVGIYAVK